MDMLAQTLVTTAVTSVVSAVVASLVSRARSGAKEMQEQQRAMSQGIRALLWRELQDIHARAHEAGGMTVADRRHLESVYGAYHGLGGNGTGTKLYTDAIALPVLD
jgi:type II secretory pathway pseudopilin PulG